MVVILQKGMTCQKKVRGIETQVTPFLGTDHQGNQAKLGVGILFKDADHEITAWFWGLKIPRGLLQSWRAMKLIELVPEIDNETLCQAWHAARSEALARQGRYLLGLEKRFPNLKAFNSARHAVLKMVPSEEALSSMLRLVRDKKLGLTDLTTLQKIADDEDYPESKKLLRELVDRAAKEKAAWEESVTKKANVRPCHPNAKGFFGRFAQRLRANHKP